MNFIRTDPDGLIAVPRYAESRLDRLRDTANSLQVLLADAKALGLKFPGMPVDSEEHLLAAVVFVSRAIWMAAPVSERAM